VDDDRLRDGNDVPMPGQPERDALRAAMREAYVEVLFDVGDNNDIVPFRRNVPAGNDPNVNTQDWDTSGQNAPDFWVAYICMAFQSQWNLRDADPNGERNFSPFGATPADGRGGSLIFYERHFEGTADPQAELRETFVRELGHVFEDKTTPEPITQNAKYVARIIEQIRRTIRPDGRTPREAG